MEPLPLPGGVTEVSSSSDTAVRELYASSYRRLVAVCGAISGDRAEAEEAVQEAFVRLMRHWNRISA